MCKPILGQDRGLVATARRCGAQRNSGAPSFYYKKIQLSNYFEACLTAKT
jgi:hypothetical protein